MEKAQVVIVRCDSYQHEFVESALNRGFDLLGGVKQFVQPGEHILFKPNILVGDDPDKCVGPHPIILEHVFKIFSGLNAHLSYGDSPGFGSLKSAVKKVGYADPAELYGVDLADFTTPVTRSFPDGHLIKQFTIAKAVDECDGLVSISKLKSHALTRTTGAIKNQFGCIPGVLKAEFHAKLPDGKLFSQMLVDLNLMIQPRLFIMDGVIGMEGNGPRNGTPKPMRVILLSTDPVALDTVVCRMINLNPRLVEPIVYGDQFGLGTMENIELIGDDIEKFIDKTFLVNRAPLSTTTESGSLTSRFMKELITPRPVIDESICTKCGRCVQICPAEPKALGWAKQNKMIPPVYHYQDCIRCYCCQELCPNEAIKVKTPLLGHLIRR
jgi:uncharacterized protein (DUF362 family)/NAD-dependent dihydropyrimidine dehydrogenase PreA subunit